METSSQSHFGTFGISFMLPFLVKTDGVNWCFFSYYVRKKLNYLQNETCMYAESQPELFAEYKWNLPSNIWIFRLYFIQMPKIWKKLFSGGLLFSEEISFAISTNASHFPKPSLSALESDCHSSCLKQFSFHPACSYNTYRNSQNARCEAFYIYIGKRQK